MSKVYNDIMALIINRTFVEKLDGVRMAAFERSPYSSNNAPALYQAPLTAAQKQKLLFAIAVCYKERHRDDNNKSFDEVVEALKDMVLVADADFVSDIKEGEYVVDLLLNKYPDLLRADFDPYSNLEESRISIRVKKLCDALRLDFYYRAKMGLDKKNPLGLVSGAEMLRDVTTAAANAELAARYASCTAASTAATASTTPAAAAAALTARYASMSTAGTAANAAHPTTAAAAPTHDASVAVTVRPAGVPF